MNFFLLIAASFFSSFYSLEMEVYHDASFLHSARQTQYVRRLRLKRVSPRVNQSKSIRNKSVPLSNTQSVPWNGYFSAQRFENSPKDRIALQSIKNNLREVIQLLPKSHTKSLKNLEIRNKTHVSRGMANDQKMILHTQSIDTSDELKAVFVHEMGHIFDLGTLNGNSKEKSAFRHGNNFVSQDDPSLGFYKLSWIDSVTKKSGTVSRDFVSGYAASNAFEDFAESYVFYRLHGEKFRKSMTESKILRRKYYFLKSVVFNGEEFQLHKDGQSFAHGGLWDVTLLPLNKPNIIAHQ